MRLPAPSGQRPLDSQLAELSPGTRALIEGIVRKLSRAAEPGANDGHDHSDGRSDEARDYRPERTLAGEDFLPVWFLRVGAERARAVARIEVIDGARTSFGTGFMVSPSLLLTNHHVLPSAALAGTARLLFDDEDDERGPARRPTLFLADPARFYFANARLDFALVAVDGDPGRQFGAVPLRHAPTGLRPRARVNIIQHPNGGRKRVVVHGNRVTQIADEAVHYLADTEGGSSGSPVFNARWELLALHHWGGAHDNVGVRVDAILKYLAVVGATRTASPLLRELLADVAGSGDFGAFSTAGLTPPAFVDEDAAQPRDQPPERAVLDWMGGPGFIDPGHWDLAPILGHRSGELGLVFAAIADVVDQAGADFMVLEGIPPATRSALTAALAARGLQTTALGHGALLYLDAAVSAEPVALSGDAATLAGARCRGRPLLPEGFTPWRLALSRRPDQPGPARALYLLYVETGGADDLPSRAHRNELARVLGAIALATGRDVLVVGSLAGVLPRPGLVELVAPPELTILAAAERPDDPDVGAIAWIGDGRGADLEQIYCAPELRALRLQPGVERSDWAPNLELPPLVRDAGYPLLVRGRFGDLDRETPAAHAPAPGEGSTQMGREIVIDAHVASLLLRDP